VIFGCPRYAVRNSTGITSKAPGRSRYCGGIGAKTTQKAPGRSTRRDLLCSSLASLAVVLAASGRAERSAPFSPARFPARPVVVGGPAGFSVAPTRDRRRDHSACQPRVAPAHPAGLRAQFCGGARDSDVREGGRRARAPSPRAKRGERSETRSVSPAAEAGEGRGGCSAVRGGSSPYGSSLVAEIQSTERVRGVELTAPWKICQPQ
jgi:hypothetical protein